MQEWTTFHNTRMRKMDAAALIANFTIDELVMRSTRSGTIRDYYDISVIQYSGEGVEPIIANEDDGLLHIIHLQDTMPQPVCYNIVQLEDDGTQSIIPITLHEWVKPVAQGISPMYEAMIHIKSLVSKWCEDRINRNSFPPIVINITDGCCGDAEEDELCDITNEIGNIGTRDGTTLIFNVQLTDVESANCQSIIFPSLNSEIDLDGDGQMLYNMSSDFPWELEPNIDEMMDGSRKGPYKCFARNASICEILAITDIGTDNCSKYR